MTSPNLLYSGPMALRPLPTLPGVFILETKYCDAAVDKTSACSMSSKEHIP